MSTPARPHDHDRKGGVGLSTGRIGFILYDNRSGSTLLSALLDRYPSVEVSSEVDSLARALEAPTRPRRTKDGREPGSNAGGRHLRAVLDDAFGTKTNATHRLVKGPRLHFHMEALCAAFPDCVFVQIVRDGRAVFSSKRRTPSPAGGVMDDNLLHAAWNWRRKLEMAAAFEERVLTVRYEDLVRDPEIAASRVLDFLGVASDQRQAERSTADYLRDKVPASHRYLHVRLNEPISSVAIDGWRRQLLPHQVLLYEMTSADALTRHGYALERYGEPQPWSLRIRAYALYLLCMARWCASWALSGLRYALTPRALMQKVRSKYGEATAPRSAHSSGPRR